MVEKQSDFKYDIGEIVQGHKYGIGLIKGRVTGRSILSMGTHLYWVRDSNGIEYKIPQFQIRGICNE